MQGIGILSPAWEPWCKRIREPSRNRLRRFRDGRRDFWSGSVKGGEAAEPDGLASRRPEADRAVHAGSNDLFAIRGEACSGKLVLTSAQGEHLAACRRVP